MLSSRLEKRIKKHPHDDLRRVADEVTVFDNKLRMQVQRMLFLMHQCEGIGLAANQLGFHNSVFVYTYEGKNHACINPRYTQRSVSDEEGQDDDAESKEKEEEANGILTGIEGCLSVPTRWLYVPRYDQIKVEYHNVAGTRLEREIEGYEARLFQHEYDHLNGKLIIDYEP